MPKKRSKSSEEWLRGQVRELTKENRALKKRLKQLEKTEHIFNEEKYENGQDDKEIVGDSEDTHPVFRQKSPCHSCGKGFLEEFELLGRVFATCNTCGERIKIK